MAKSKPEYDLRVIKVVDIRENPVALRAVDREDEKYIGLRDSVAKMGVLNAISVRERVENIEGKDTPYFELCDGLHRYSAACECGVATVPVRVLSLDDAGVLEAQVMANVHKIDTKPVEYTKQMNRIFAGNPTMTVADMAAKLCKSGTWVSQRLGLLKLDDAVAVLVDDGKITVSNAVALAKLPKDEQIAFVDQAMTQAAEVFAPTVQARAKELRDAARQGRAPGEAVFQPVARCQKMCDLKAELSAPTIGPPLCAQQKCKTAADGFALAVQWVLNMDPVSVGVQQAKAEEKKQRLEEEKKKRVAERTQLKADEAAKAAAKAAEAVI